MEFLHTIGIQIQVIKTMNYGRITIKALTTPVQMAGKCHKMVLGMILQLRIHQATFKETKFLRGVNLQLTDDCIR